MTLPSQTTNASTRALSPRRGHTPQILGALAVTAIAVGAVWWATSGRAPADKGSDTLLAGAPGTTPAAKESGTDGILTSAIRNASAGAPNAPETGNPGLSDPGATNVVEPSGVTPPPAGPATPQNPAVSEPIAPNASTADVRSMIAEADRKLAANDLVGARTLLNRALADTRTSPSDQASLRDRLAKISDDLIFAPKVYAGEAFTESYTVKPSDSLVKIARERDLATDWRLIQRVNRITDPGMLKVGQKLKLVRGPFNAVVHRGEFRLDLFAGAPDDPAGWTFVRSFAVGLGADNSTPIGDFIVKRGSRLINPPWANPRTGEKFSADDPKNPIGERWIGLEGVGPSAVHVGYGLHGTIEPESIGQQKSMGCVRLAAGDIELLYELLVDRVSVVKIQP